MQFRRKEGVSVLCMSFWETRKRDRFRRFALVLLLALVLPPFALAGQTVIINGGMMDKVYGGYAYTGNSVTINGGTMNYVYGGYADTDSGSPAISGNSVIVNGGTVGYVHGGYAYTAGSGSATASGNSVTINGGMVDSNVFGGDASTVVGSATASGNSVTINGGIVQFSVVGGRAHFDRGAGSATATHNTVTLSGSPVFTSATGLYGGYTADVGGTGDVFTGNTLNVWNYTGTAAMYSVQNFEFYNFILPASQGNAPVLTAAVATFGDGTGKASVIMANTVGGTPLQPGVAVTLIDGAIKTQGLSYTRATGLHGATLAYDWALDAANGLVARLDSVQANPRAKALSEGFLSSLALTNQGADLVAGQGMGNAAGAAHGAGGSGFGAFAALSGGSMRYNTGSHVDMSSLSLMAGLARGADTGYGRLTGGAFAEFGTGSYDTYNSFSNAASAGGDGDAHSLGGGVLGRMDFADAGAGRFYAEASARMGRLHNEYRSSDLRDALGRSAKGYDSSSLYYGLHFGTGYVRDIGEKASLDLYGKYFWTRQEGDSVTLSTNDPVRFKDADSHRLRLGARYVYAATECLSPYAGAAFEYEFDGEARASTYGYAIDAPSLRGGTGTAEIGVRLAPSAALPLSIDLGVQGYVGKREGVSGGLRLGWAF